MIPSDNLNRRIDQTLYMLKRSFGGTISIYQMGDATLDHKTGIRTIPRTVSVVNRAIILPVKISREVVQSISIISANKSFVVGGTYDTGSRMFIVERDDAPDLDLTESDWLVYRNRRYQIKEFQAYEFETAYLIVGKEVKGEVPEQIYPLAADNLIRLDHTSDQTS